MKGLIGLLIDAPPIEVVFTPDREMRNRRCAEPEQACRKHLCILDA